MLAQALQFIAVYYFGGRFYDMGISLKSLGEILSIAFITSWVANELLVRANLWEDLAIKTIAYLFAILLTIFTFWVNPNTRFILCELIQKLFRKKRAI